jgi:signal transduction histidine kinase
MRDNNVYRMHAHYGLAREAVQYSLLHPMKPDRSTATGRVALEGRPIHIPDVLADPEYQAPDYQQIFKYRTVLSVPMLRDGTTIGTFSLLRDEVSPFTDKQIELVTTFGDQAVIAIENVRLLDELRHRTEELGRSVGELRALGEVSQAVNSTLELEIVLSTIVAKAVQLSGTEAGAIYVFDDRQREFHLRATYGMDRELIDALAQRRIGLDDPNVAQVLAQPEPIQIADLRKEATNEINEITLRAGYLARLSAPLIRGKDVVGLLVVRRRTAGVFPQNTVDLIKTFAAQSAVAIENARLFQNVETSLQDLRTTQDRLVQTQKLASLGQLTAGIAHEIKNPLNFVNNFSGVSVELIDELEETLASVKANNKTRAAITELANTLRGNLEKIVQHGKRADSIVKNMLLHSREGSGEHRPVDVNALVEESLNLAYHGARAENQGFKINMERSFDPAAGQVDVYPQEITRALLNLISNGFYAATKQKDPSNSEGFEPTLTAVTKNLGDKVEISIRDNGTGIPPEVKEKMFNPFFTTKPAGEGTGLGLSISHDIIVKQHAGSIEVDTQPGEYAEVRVILPRAAAFIVA